MNSTRGAERKVSTEAGMFALRERRIHASREDFDMAVGKAMMKKDSDPECQYEEGQEGIRLGALASKRVGRCRPARHTR